MALHIYTKAERAFMTNSFHFHTYNTRVFMTKSFLLYKKVLHKGFSPSKNIIMKLLTNKTTDRHRDILPVVGGGGAMLWQQSA